MTETPKPVEALARAITAEDYSESSPVEGSSLTPERYRTLKVDSRWPERIERAEVIIAYLDRLGYVVAQKPAQYL